jgi:acetoacetyl-CoA synthetase
MMWNWLVSALGTGATVVLYDGSPLLDDGRILFNIAEQESITVFGTNPKYLSLIEKNGLRPKETHNLTALRTVLSTGSPLLPENFEYVYNAIKSDICLSSISGGTDIIGCFALGSPMLPVFSGELQTRSLGYKVDVYNTSGQAVVGEKGELVCTAPFPSMPIYFWNDNDHARRIKSYFKRFPSVWHHGDYVSVNEHGGMVFYGRSDAVLNPGGVRIGTAEIYRQVETLPAVLDCMAVGQEWKGDSRVVLFVKLQEGLTLDDEITGKIKTRLRTNASPFHVPSKIIQVTDIPRTRSGKIVELTVTALINGIEPDNIEALANPECLTEYRNIESLQGD